MKSTTYYTLLLDASGSMSNVRLETLNAVNAQIEAIRTLAAAKPSTDIRVTLTTFHTEVRNVFRELNPQQAPLLTQQQYTTDGSTALLDALGLRMTELERTVSIHDDVVIVVLTDGAENASQYYTYRQIADKIASLKKTERWSFSFLGADIDAWESARHLNFDRQEVKSVNKSRMDIVFNEMNDKLHTYIDKKSKGEKNKGLYNMD
jgi:Mg-chelatase subunit ChlD